MTNDATEQLSGQGCCAPETETDAAIEVTWGNGRTIGPWGTTVRALAGVAGLGYAVAIPHEHPLLELPGASSNVVGLLVGLVVIPVALTLAIRARGRNAPRLQLGHGAACLVTLLTIGVAQFYPVAILVGIAAPLILQVAVGRRGCELLTVPNLVLRRNDYLFCLPFSPIDAWDRRRRDGHQINGQSHSPSSRSTPV